jgi:hypothetical protein
MEKALALAFPKRESDRARLRSWLRAHTDVRMPALYPHGIERACMTCGMVLDVGPRLAALLAERQDGITLVCPLCVPSEAAQRKLQVQHLGNPDSRPEDENA